MKPPIDSVAFGLLCALALLCAEAASATPMRCSGEEKTCIAACKKSPNQSSITICITNCGVRQSVCMKTGCWDTGFQKYCSLLRQ